MIATLLLAASCCSPVKDAPVDYAALSEPAGMASPRVLQCIFPGRRARREAAIAAEASALTAASLAPALSSSMLMQAVPMAIQAAPMAVAQSGCYEAPQAFQAAPSASYAAPMATAPSSCYSSSAPMQAAPPSYREVQSAPAFAAAAVPILTSVPTYRYAPGVTTPLTLQPAFASGGCPGGVCPPASGGFLAADLPPVIADLPSPGEIGPVAYVIVALASLAAGAGGKMLLDALKARAEGKRADLKASLEANGTRSALDRSHYDDLLRRQGDELTAARQAVATSVADLRRCTGEAGRLRAMVDLLMKAAEEQKATGGRSFSAGPFPVGVLTLGPDGLIMGIGEHVLSILHYHASELLRKNVRELIPPDRHPILDSRLAALAGPPEGHPNPFEIVESVALAKGDRPVPILLRMVPWAEAGRPTLITLYLQERPGESFESFSENDIIP